MNIYQDSAGITPVVNAGEPIGKIIPQFGDYELTQTEALDKPIFASFPKGGVKNIAYGAQAINDTTYWSRTSVTTNGITCEYVDSGVDEDGYEYVDMRFHGTPIASTAMTLYQHIHNSIPITDVIGKDVTISAEVKVVGGTPESNRGLRVTLFESRIPGGDNAANTHSPSRSPATYTGVTATRTIEGVDTALYVYGSVGFTCSTGVAVDVTLRIRKLQMEISDTQTTLQRNYGIYHVVGAENVEHIYNDGADVMNIDLGSKVCSIAILTYDSGIKYYEAQTGVVNILKDIRIVDIVIKEGTFSTTEKSALSDFWS